MLFYIIHAFLVALSSFCVTYAKNRYAVFVFKLATFLIFLIPLAFRYQMGADYDSYHEIFDTIKRGGIPYTDDPGFLFLNSIVIQLGGSYQMFLAVIATLTIFYFFYGVPKERWFIYSLAFLFIPYTWCYTSIRQMLAVALAFYAWRQHQNKRHIYTIMALVGAIMFHSSSIIYPLLYIIFIHLPINRSIVFIVALCSMLVVYFFTAQLISMITEIVLLNPDYASYASGYNPWFDSTNLEISSGYGRILRYIIYFLIIICFNPNDNLASKVLILAFLLYIGCDFMSNYILIVNRITRGLMFVILPILYTISIGRHSSHKRIYLIIIWLGFFLLYITNVEVPYISIFNI